MRSHHRIIHLAVLCLAAAAFLPLLTSCASALRDRRVLVMNFENAVPGGEKEASYSNALAEMVTASLANSPRIALLDRQSLTGLLSQTAGPKALLWQDIGRKAKADYVLVGSISRLEQNYLINARLLSVKTGEIVKGSSISRYARREEDIYPAVQAMCTVLSYQLKYLAELYDAKDQGRPAPPPALPAPPAATASKAPAAPVPSVTVTTDTPAVVLKK